MKTMTISLIAAFAVGCASKPVEDLPTDELESSGGDSTDTDDDDDDDSNAAADDDGDGVTVGEGDCNDDDDKVFPGAEEECNGIDDDCDEDIDEGLDTTPFYQDADDDDYGNPDEKIDACEKPDGYVENDEDCDDTEASANPEGEEVSFNDIDENCDGLDFGEGEECVSGALELTMDWMDYWTWPMDDSDGAFSIYAGVVTGTYDMEQKYLDVQPESTEAEAVEGDPLKVNVTIETKISMQAHMTAIGEVGFGGIGLFEFFPQNCTLTINEVPVVYTGQVELDLDGELVTGTAELEATVLDAADYDTELYPDAGEGEVCEFDTINTVVNYFGLGIDAFISTDIAEVAEALGTQIEEDLRDWDIPAACTPDYEPEQTELCNDDCEYSGDGECDDGGEGSDFAICDYGSDCTDCGIRFD